MRIFILLGKGYPAGCLQRLAARVFGLLRNTCWPAANETKLHEAREIKPLVPRVGKGWTTRKVMGGGGGGGGGVGNFPAAGIFCRYQIPCMKFFFRP